MTNHSKSTLERHAVACEAAARRVTKEIANWNDDKEIQRMFRREVRDLRHIAQLIRGDLVKAARARFNNLDSAASDKVANLTYHWLMK